MSELTPTALATAIAVHLIVTDAEGASAQADALLVRAGLTRADVARATWMLDAGPDAVEAEARRIAGVLLAIRASDVAIDLIETHDRQADETRVQRSGRCWNAGWCDRLRGRPAATSVDQVAYDLGRQACDRLIVVFELGRSVASPQSQSLAAQAV